MNLHSNFLEQSKIENNLNVKDHVNGYTYYSMKYATAYIITE